MANRKTKLELTWIGKDARPKLEPRILLEDTSLSFRSPRARSEQDLFNNVLVQGDNLLALKALEQEFSQAVKCVYIDPPFNTGQAFEHYEDGQEHSEWLNLMSQRIEVIYRLLRDDGVLYVHLDQEEVHYLKVVLDEIFGRAQFLGQIAYERSGVSGIGQGGAFLVNTHEYILAYTKTKPSFVAADLAGEDDFEPKDMKRYNRVLVSPGTRKEVGRFEAPSTGEPVVIFKHSGEEFRTISLRDFEHRKDEIVADYVQSFDAVFRLTSIQAENAFQNRILESCKAGFFSADYLVSRGRREGERVTAYYYNGQAAVWLRDSARVHGQRIVRTGKLSDFWTHADIPKANLANEGGVDFRRGKKPELLLYRLLRLVTKRGDIVLDSFAGSGSTGAVAHEMGLRWIMIELGEQATTHIVPRMQAVLNGSDRSGASETLEWKGGGGFRFYRLATSLLEKDKWGQWVVSRKYNAAMLAEAVCKLHGFRYDPSATVFWQHGRSTERDYIYVTTQSLLHEQLAALSDDVGPERTLLVVCSAFRTKRDAFPNLTIKKIPASVLTSCEWGRDDYSLNVANVMPAEEHPPSARAPAAKRGKKAENGAQPRLPGLGGDT